MPDGSDVLDAPSAVGGTDAEAISHPAASREVGVGPHPQPWPEGARFDPDLLEHGDRRNVEDRFRYWRREAIIAELDTHRHELHVAIENLEHDANIGSVVRTANAFAVGAFHIVGRRRWNRRGAMVTDRYQHEFHHPDAQHLIDWARSEGRPLVAIDLVEGALPIERTSLPRNAVLVVGQEGPGVSAEILEAAQLVVGISQFGSTRSINVAAAAAIAMHSWVLQHAELPAGPLR
ncbi:TrmH family RNA methyltransferase [Brachybacterium sp. AOP24-D1-21]|uniref:TrmH family RNA methyltransferase n=1 Tax=Brachybacterium sp. AOP24-D1-21 TaxID=3457711 RepID=UPI00403489F3